jgi:hypothetical protein
MKCTEIDVKSVTFGPVVVQGHEAEVGIFDGADQSRLEESESQNGSESPEPLRDEPECDSSFDGQWNCDEWFESSTFHSYWTENSAFDV